VSGVTSHQAPHPGLPGPVGEVGAGGQGVRVLGARHLLAHRQQPGELLTVALCQSEAAHPRVPVAALVLTARTARAGFMVPAARGIGGCPEETPTASYAPFPQVTTTIDALGTSNYGELMHSPPAQLPAGQHAPPQQVSPEGQHIPLQQVSPEEQQVAPQQVAPEEQHVVPLQQVSAAAQQVAPQQSLPGGHGAAEPRQVQCPWKQCLSAPQTLPQPPQLSLSVNGSMQQPIVVPDAQGHPMRSLGQQTFADVQFVPLGHPASSLQSCSPASYLPRQTVTAVTHATIAGVATASEHPIAAGAKQNSTKSRSLRS
jgi:hypothetical protein